MTGYRFSVEMYSWTGLKVTMRGILVWTAGVFMRLSRLFLSRSEAFETFTIIKTSSPFSVTLSMVVKKLVMHVFDKAG